MAEKLIINTRKNLHWHRRIATDAVTALMWLGWLFLWWPMLHKLYELHQRGFEVGTAALWMLETISPVSMGHSVLALIGTSALLLFWTMLPSQRAEEVHKTETLQDYGDYFELNPEEITAGRTSAITIVHHDDEGHIIGIEVKKAA